MLKQQREALKKVQTKLSVLRTLNDAFQTALAAPALQKHEVTRLIAMRAPILDFIAELDTYEATLLKSIDHLEKQK